MSRQRTYALRAYEEIAEIRKSPHASKLKTLCMKTPSLIHQSGAVQSVAFLRSREKKIGTDFCNHLARVLGLKDGDALHTEAFKQGDVTSYMLFTTNLSDAAVWLRRFAQSELSDVDADDVEEDHE